MYFTVNLISNFVCKKGVKLEHMELWITIEKFDCLDYGN